MSKADLLVSPSETLTLLRALERRAVRALETDISKLTLARLRYLEHYGVGPAVRGSGVKGHAVSRLYGVVDVALLRMWLRLSAEVGPMAARFTLAYEGGAIRDALQRSRPLVLVVRGKRAELVTVRAAGDIEDAAAAVSLLDVLAGVEDAIRAVRENEPYVWAGRDWLTPAEAVEEFAAV
jgi:hypothetical protein